MSDKINYDVSKYGDRLTPGHEAKINHLVFLRAPDISKLTGTPAAVLEKLRQESVAKEETIFSELRDSLQEWEKQAANTHLLEKALQYVKTPPVKHTENRWVKDEYGQYSISNMVYKMNYRIWENTRYGQKEPLSWELSWYLHIQDPSNSRSDGRIAGQERKRFANKAAMDKYLQGRIKVYAHLFTEISPPVPQEYIQRFTVNGQLLPGYKVESAQEKASVLGALAKAKALAQERFRKGDDFNAPPHLSPWGEVKDCKKLCSGVFQVTAGEHTGIMVAKEVVAILSPLTCKGGEERGGFLCFEDKAPVLRDLVSKKLLSQEQSADKATPVKKSKQEVAR